MTTIDKQTLEMLTNQFKPYVEKLIPYLKKKGIETEFGEVNMIFKSRDKTMEICYGCFYRWWGGVCIVHKEKGESGVELVEVTDAMWIDSYMRMCVEVHFKE